MIEDVVLREIQEADLELIRSWRTSERVSKYLYTASEITPEQQKQWFHNTQKDETSKYWMITCEGKPLGVASLYGMQANFKKCYWAFYLGDTSIRGKGVGSKVEYQVCEYVFDKLDYNKLLCEVFVWNEGVIKMHEKFGFRRESYFRQHILKDGEWIDVVGLSLLQQEWKQLKESLRNKIARK